MCSFWSKEFLPDWWNERNRQEAEKRGVSVQEWDGFERDQRVIEEHEHRGRVSLAGDAKDRNYNSKD